MPSDVVQRRPASLALRLTASIGIAITLLFWALGWVIQHSIEQHFMQQDVEELEVVAHSVERVLSSMPDAAPEQDISRRLAGAVSGHHGMYYLVADGTGQTLFATPGPKIEALVQTQSAASGVDAAQLHQN